MSNKPLIGIVSAVHHSPQGWPFLRAYDANVKAIERVGGVPVIIPCTLQDEALRDLYERLDGVLLPGGGDVDPVSYGDTPRTTIKMVDPPRDRTEIQLTRWSVDEGVPIFGICRGHQVFNVALGGSLIQDIDTFVATTLQHDISEGMPRNTLLHEVTVDDQSQLHQILKHSTVRVNSLHHQAIDRVADGLVTTAQASDGLVEGLEVPGHPFALTVQWHPEDLVDDAEEMLELFRSFVEAASTRKNA